MPSAMPNTVCTAMPAAKLFTLNRDSSTSGEPSLAAFAFSYAMSAPKTTSPPAIMA